MKRPFVILQANPEVVHEDWRKDHDCSASKWSSKFHDNFFIKLNIKNLIEIKLKLNSTCFSFSLSSGILILKMENRARYRENISSKIDVTLYAFRSTLWRADFFVDSIRCNCTGNFWIICQLAHSNQCKHAPAHNTF